jgi:hypothetical protein
VQISIAKTQSTATTMVTANLMGSTAQQGAAENKYQLHPHCSITQQLLKLYRMYISCTSYMESTAWPIILVWTSPGQVDKRTMPQPIFQAWKYTTMGCLHCLWNYFC